MLSLTPERALIFRIMHRDNVAWTVANGFHCRNSALADPGFVPIGNPDLIEHRRDMPIPIPPCGVLGDYIPFYFTPRSPMLYNIRTGHRGIRKRANAEIVVAVACLHDLLDRAIPFVVSDRHAYLATASFSSGLDGLQSLDWAALQASDFRRDPENPEKFERYQAEALIHRHLPANGLRGWVCFDDDAKAFVTGLLDEHGLSMTVATRPGWYFP
ncbi:protein of unknown function [Rhodospira trueperi]|uniref:DarT domain-containing protein n=2 Tax=Rhodospira trueperi TaxID=69960 RepID=A0A1G6YUP7_9PROT|nr:protein of unknown function [Rhodospira trueperi]